MKFGMNMLLWTTRVTEKHLPQLESLKETGYDTIELPIFEPDVDHYAQIGKRLDELDLERTVVTARTAEDNTIDPDPAVRAKGIELTKRTIDCCVAAGVETMTGPFHSAFGYFSGSGPTEDEWRWGIEAMQDTADYARGQGVDLALEFLNRFECYLLNTTADTARFVRDVGMDNVGILYDTHHANIEEKDVSRAIHDHASLITHVHISENDRSTPGRGQVHWTETFDALNASGYNRRFVVEAFGLALPELIPVVHVWRKMFDTEEQLARDALLFMQEEWDARAG